MSQSSFAFEDVLLLGQKMDLILWKQFLERLFNTGIHIVYKHMFDAVLIKLTAVAACHNCDAIFISSATSRAESDSKSGARMIVVKEGSMIFDIAYLGDCFALAKYENGHVSMTENWAYKYNSRMYALIEQYWTQAARHLKINPDKVEQGTEQWNNLRLEMWRLFGPQLQTERRLHINNSGSGDGHGVLNGQDVLSNLTSLTFFSKKIGKTFSPLGSYSPLHYILLGNNGCVPWDMEKDVPRTELAKRLAKTVNHEDNPAASLDAIIAQARRIEQATKISHAKGGRAYAACALIIP